MIYLQSHAAILFAQSVYVYKGVFRFHRVTPAPGMISWEPKLIGIMFSVALVTGQCCRSWVSTKHVCRDTIIKPPPFIFQSVSVRTSRKCIWYWYRIGTSYHKFKASIPLVGASFPPEPTPLWHWRCLQPFLPRKLPSTVDTSAAAKI